MNADFDEFVKDLEDNSRSTSSRAGFFKLQNGDNRMVLLTNPVGYSELFNVGIAYEGCGYGQYAPRRYKAYVLDLRDPLLPEIKMANLSYTVASAINDLRLGARTKFDTLPCPYIMNLKTENAGKKEIKTSVIAEEDYEVSEERMEELKSLDSIRDIIERMKIAQKKKVENDPSFQEKINRIIEQKENERAQHQHNKSQDSSMNPRSIDTIDLDAEDEGDIPF